MKKQIMTIAIAIFTIVGTTTITSCKKGENDPFLSLKSRKARVTGEWKLTSGTNTRSNVFSGNSSTTTVTYAETTYSETYSSGGDFSANYSNKITINKDGSFDEVVVLGDETITIKGSWAFLGKSKELKNKEAIILTISSYTEDGGANTYSEAYNKEQFFTDRTLLLDKLSNKEMTVKIDSKITEDDGDTITETGTVTFTKQ